MITTSSANGQTYPYISPALIHLKEKKLKYKRLARKAKESLAKREQELTDLIIDSTELKNLTEKMKRENREETERMRGEIGRLMGENHRYSRDIDRLVRENSDLKEQLNDVTHRRDHD